MATMKTLLLAVVLPALCRGFVLDSFTDQSDWNGLKATWGINPFSAFGDLPRTRSDATSAGWAPMSGQSGCSGTFLGSRYIKDNDMGIILIYGPNGYIAGIQAGVSKSYSPNPNNFPPPQSQGHPMILVGDTYYITAYFVDPATLCNGRQKSDFDSQGTGTGLWIQNGTDPVRNSIKIPATQAEVDKTEWTKGACFRTMGVHYWYKLRTDMDCDDFFPVFLLYNKGVLNAFGWAFQLDITNSKHYEHPPQNSYGNFMTPPPTCIDSRGTMTTLHIYLTNLALMDQC